MYSNALTPFLNGIFKTIVKIFLNPNPEDLDCPNHMYR